LTSALPAEKVVPAPDPDSFLTEARRLFPQAREETLRRGGNGFWAKSPVHRTMKTPPSGEEPAVRPRTEGLQEVGCLYEGFEEVPIWWEEGGSWFHYEEGRGNAEGDYFWLDSDCDAATGDWMASATWGGDYGQTLSCDAFYDFDTRSWMKYAYWIDCAHLQEAANLEFAMRISTEEDYDLFGYYASDNDYDYFGYVFSGDFSQTWYLVAQDLRQWYGLGDLTRIPEFALAFNFDSDDRVETGFGAYVDDIYIGINELQITDVWKRGRPFRLKVYGSNFQPGAWVYIDGLPAPKVKFKHSGLIVAKKGRRLKAMCPRGVEVCIQVINPSGNTSACCGYTR